MGTLLWGGAVCAAVGVGIWLLMIGKSQPVALASAVASFAALGALASAETAFYALVAVSCVDGFLKSAVPSAISVVLKDIFLALALGHWLWGFALGHPRPSTATPVALPALLFVLYCIAQMFNSENMSWILALAGLRSWIIWIPVFFIVYDTMYTRRQLDRLILIIAVLSAATAIYGVVQTKIGFGHLYNISPNFSFYRVFMQGEAVRAPSTYVNPGTAGEAMGFAAVACGGAALAAVFSVRQLILAAGGVLSAIGMLATASRAPMLGAMTALTTATLLSRAPRLVIGLMLVAVVGAWQAGRHVGPQAFDRYQHGMLSRETIVARVRTPLENALVMLARYPLGTGIASGVGTGRALHYVDQPVAVKETVSGFVENEFGRAMKELGLPGFALFMWMLWRVISLGVRGTLRCRGRDRVLAAALMSAAIGVAMQLWVGSALYLAPGGIYFWMACALAARMPEHAEAEQAAAVPERTPEQVDQWRRLQQRVGRVRVP